MMILSDRSLVTLVLLCEVRLLSAWNVASAFVSQGTEVYCQWNWEGDPGGGLTVTVVWVFLFLMSPVSKSMM